MSLLGSLVSSLIRRHPRKGFGIGAVIALLLALPLPASSEEPYATDETNLQMAAPMGPVPQDRIEMGAFLDRLMIAESGGRDDARNPRSTAVGPFQFIESTFLDVARRHFPTETAALTPTQVLALRVNRTFSRRAAEAFTLDNAAILASAGLPTTFPNLRLAFLVGPGGALRLLRTPAATPAISVLGVQVVQANPFMAGMTSGDLIAWSSRNLAGATQRIIPGGPALASAAIGRDGLPVLPKARAKPKINIACNTSLASCRRWVALAERNAAKRAPRPIRKAGGTSGLVPR